MNRSRNANSFANEFRALLPLELPWLPLCDEVPFDAVLVTLPKRELLEPAREEPVDDDLPLGALLPPKPGGAEGIEFLPLLD